MINLDNLFKYIYEKGLNAKKVSEATGISGGNISDWKNGRSMPSAIKLYDLAEYLDCSIDFLLGRTDNPNSHKILKETKISVEQHKKDIPKNVSITAEELIESSKNNIKNIKKEDL